MNAPCYLIRENVERPVFGFGTPDFFVAQIPRSSANEIIARHHYSKRIVQSSRLHFGVFNPALVGVLQFGPAMNPQSMASVVAGTKFEQYLELNRMWLDDSAPRNSESRALSYAMRMIRRIDSRIAWVQSFADERCGCLGVVYQAANFVFCGSHMGKFWHLPGKDGGEWFHDSLVTDTTKQSSPRAARILARLHRARKVRLRQFRYIYFLKTEFRKRLLKREREYPKHAAQVSGKTRRLSKSKSEVQALGAAPIRRA